MSTTLLIGRCPAAIRRAFSHGGDGPIFTSSNSLAGEARAQRRARRPRPRPRRPAPSRARVLVPRRRRQRRAGGRVDLARDPVDAEAVGPVRRDLQLEHVGGDRQHLGERRAGRRAVAVLVQHQDPGVVGADRRARPRRGSSPADSTPRSLAVPSFVPSGITAPGRATATVCPAATLGAPQTIWAGSPSPDVDAADAQAVGVGVRGRPRAPARRRTPRARRRRGARCARPCVPVIVEALGELGRLERRVGQYSCSQLQRDPHPNCSRNRTSLS